MPSACCAGGHAAAIQSSFIAATNAPRAAAQAASQCSGSNASSQFAMTTLPYAETAKFLETAEEIAGPYLWGRYDLLLLPPSFPCELASAATGLPARHRLALLAACDTASSHARVLTALPLPAMWSSNTAELLAVQMEGWRTPASRL